MLFILVNKIKLPRKINTLFNVNCSFLWNGEAIMEDMQCSIEFFQWCTLLKVPLQSDYIDYKQLIASTTNPLLPQL